MGYTILLHCVHPTPLPSVTDSGARSQRYPTVRFKPGNGARERHRGIPAMLAGEAERGRARHPARSTRKTTTNPKTAAPLANGRRRRRQRQWRTAVFYRQTRRRLPRTVTMIQRASKRGNGSDGCAISPRTRRDGRRGRRRRVVAGIEEEDGAV